MATDDVPEGLSPFDDVMRDDRDQDAGVLTVDNDDRSPFERPELPVLPEQEFSGIPWGQIQKGIETLALGAKTTAEIYRVVSTAITGKDPFNGVPINIPTGEQSQGDKDLARIRKLADGS